MVRVFRRPVYFQIILVGHNSIRVGEYGAEFFDCILDFVGGRIGSLVLGTLWLLGLIQLEYTRALDKLSLFPIKGATHQKLSGSNQEESIYCALDNESRSERAWKILRPW